MRVGRLLLVGALLCGLTFWVTREPEPASNFGLSGQPGRLVRRPPESTEKVLKVLESANHHNDRLDQMDQQLFGDTASR